MTRGELLDQVQAALDERLVVEEPPAFGRGLIVTKGIVDAVERVLVVQPRGPQFAVTVSEVDFSVASGAE